MSNISLTSELTIDKVAYKNPSGSISVPTAATSADFTEDVVNHDLGFIPNCIAIYSDDPAFQTYYVSGLPPYFFFSLANLYLPRIDLLVEADANSIRTKIQNLDTTRQIYYKVIGLIPKDVTFAKPLAQALRDEKLFSSDRNFCKIFIDDFATINMASGSNYTIPIPHSLGYKPMAIVHSRYGGRSRRSGSESQFDTSVGYSTRSWVDENFLYIQIVTTSASGDIRVDYKIYKDE